MAQTTFRPDFWTTSGAFGKARRDSLTDDLQRGGKPAGLSLKVFTGKIFHRGIFFPSRFWEQSGSGQKSENL
jgi:hypothetical protein